MLAVVVGRVALARLFGLRSKGGGDAERAGAVSPEFREADVMGGGAWQRCVAHRALWTPRQPSLIPEPQTRMASVSPPAGTGGQPAFG